MTEVVRPNVKPEAGPALRRRRASHFSISNMGATRSHLVGQHEANRLSIPESKRFLHYRETVIPLAELAISMGSVATVGGYNLAYQMRDEYFVSMPLAGAGFILSNGEEIGHDDRSLLFVRPFARVDKHWSSTGETINLHIPAHALTRMLELHGSQLPASLPPVMAVDRDRIRSFASFLQATWRDLELRDWAGPAAPTAQHLQQTLLSLLVEAVAHEGQARAEAPVSPAAPVYVRRAEAFMRANLAHRIGLEDLCTAVGASARSLQYGFASAYGLTPMEYLRKLRLDRAREMLGQDRSDVAAVALAVGYFDASAFSRSYRAQFGEPPSQTARTAFRSRSSAA